jgi:CDP-diacylglycerol--glycerol-3-phosphate 3-phosphatidyltransferase
MFPVLLLLIYKDEENIFSVLFVINIITDLLDGWAARRFDATTPLGAKLDSIADIGSYILAVIAIIQFHWESFRPFQLWVYVFLFLYIFAIIFCLIKFKTMPSLHLYSFKFVGFAQGLFLGILFCFQFVPWLFVTAMICGIIANIEEIACLIKLSKMKSNVNSFFSIKNQKA